MHAVHIMEKFPRHWSFKMGIHRLPVHSPNRAPLNSPHKGQWRGALNKRLSTQSRDADDLRSHGADHDVIVMVHVENLWEKDSYNGSFSYHKDIIL